MYFLLGLDAGTTAFKSVLFDQEGQTVATAVREYTLQYPTDSMVELDADVYWNACTTVLKDIIEKWGGDVKEIKALAISSQGETLIPVDQNGNALRKAIVWLDNRAEDEAKIIEDVFGIKNTFAVTGQPNIVPTWPAAKILWIKKNEPSIFAKVHKYLLLEDYIIFNLTGKFIAECSLLSSSLLFDINRGTWWNDMLAFLDITSESLPEIKEPGQIVGELTDEAVKDIGLAKNTLVVTGALDQAAATIGAGNVQPGIVTESTGGALAICATVEKPVFDPQHTIPCLYHAVPKKYFLHPWCQTAGMVLRWFRDQFCEAEMEFASAKGIDIYNILTEKADKIPPGSEGILMLPHLVGAFTPECNSRARGVYFGFSLKSTKAHFIRALLESVAFMLKRNLQLLEELGINISEIRSVGGGAKSLLWNRIKADVTQKPIITLEKDETACLGAAILAGNAIDVFKNIEEACEKMVTIKEKIEPDNTNFEVYSTAYKKYVSLYEAVESLF